MSEKQTKVLPWLDDVLGHDAQNKPVTRRTSIQAQCGDRAIAYIEDAIASVANLQTPSSHWAAKGEADPHGVIYSGERATLALGHMTDDELANGVYMNGNVNPSPTQLISGKAFSPIVWLTAAKERIRWLSRALVKSQQELKELRDEIDDLAAERRFYDE